MVRIAINGFGRIGRLALKAALKKKNMEIVAINDITDIPTLCHLLKYDSIHGQFSGLLKYDDKNLIVEGHKIRVLAELDPSKLPWSELGADIILESTGKFTQRDKASAHLKAGAQKIVISAPAKGDVKTIVLGVNDQDLKEDDDIISNASCTTNCLAPMVKVLDDNWGIVSGYMTTIHAYTSDQRVQDAPHKDLRRARTAAMSIIPTSTGAAKAIGLVIPHLQGKIDGIAMRVPVPDGSITDFTCVLHKSASKEEINNAFKDASSKSLKSILEYTEDPIVSADIIGNTHSCVFDALLTGVNNNMVKVVGWYDNEAGYASRIADLLEKIGKFVGEKV